MDTPTNVIAIATAGVKLSQTLFQFGRDVRHAAKYIDSIASNMADLANILMSLGDLLKDAKSLIKPKLLADTQTILERCERHQRKVQKLVSKQRKMPQLWWIYKKSEIKEMLDDIAAVKSSVNTVVSTMNFALAIRRANEQPTASNQSKAKRLRRIVDVAVQANRRQILKIQGHINAIAWEHARESDTEGPSVPLRDDTDEPWRGSKKALACPNMRTNDAATWLYWLVFAPEHSQAADESSRQNGDVIGENGEIYSPDEFKDALEDLSHLQPDDNDPVLKDANKPQLANRTLTDDDQYPFQHKTNQNNELTSRHVSFKFSPTLPQHLPPNNYWDPDFGHVVEQLLQVWTSLPASQIQQNMTIGLEHMDEALEEPQEFSESEDSGHERLLLDYGPRPEHLGSEQISFGTGKSAASKRKEHHGTQTIPRREYQAPSFEEYTEPPSSAAGTRNESRNRPWSYTISEVASNENLTSKNSINNAIKPPTTRWKDTDRSNSQRRRAARNARMRMALDDSLDSQDDYPYNNLEAYTKRIYPTYPSRISRREYISPYGTLGHMYSNTAQERIAAREKILDESDLEKERYAEERKLRRLERWTDKLSLLTDLQKRLDMSQAEVVDLREKARAEEIMARKKLEEELRLARKELESVKSGKISHQEQSIRQLIPMSTPWKPTQVSGTSDLLDTVRDNGWKLTYMRGTKGGVTWYSGQDPIHITRFDPSYAPPADGQRDQSQKEYLAVPTNILDIDALQASSVRFESFPDGLTTLPPSLTYIDIEHLVTLSFAIKDARQRAKARKIRTSDDRREKYPDQPPAFAMEYAGIRSADAPIPSADDIMRLPECSLSEGGVDSQESTLSVHSTDRFYSQRKGRDRLVQKPILALEEVEDNSKSLQVRENARKANVNAFTMSTAPRDMTFPETTSEAPHKINIEPLRDQPCLIEAKSHDHRRAQPNQIPSGLRCEERKTTYGSPLMASENIDGGSECPEQTDIPVEFFDIPHQGDDAVTDLVIVEESDHRKTAKSRTSKQKRKSRRSKGKVNSIVTDLNEGHRVQLSSRKYRPPSVAEADDEGIS